MSERSSKTSSAEQNGASRPASSSVLWHQSSAVVNHREAAALHCTVLHCTGLHCIGLQPLSLTRSPFSFDRVIFVLARIRGPKLSLGGSEKKGEKEEKRNSANLEMMSLFMEPTGKKKVREIEHRWSCSQ